MDKITEVGQKMRSAIKAKLIELGSYVDDELPDYIMVMVANHRTKDMMAEDLQLFLNENTEAFVVWLHQVLKKLQEVTVTSIDVPKITKQEAKLKRKITEAKPVKSKKMREKSPELPKKAKVEPEISLTDEIPVSANTIVKKRISLKATEQSSLDKITSQIEDKFDIPSVSEVDTLELAEIETRIEAARKKLAMLDNDEDDFINLKADDELFDAEFSEDFNKPLKTNPENSNSNKEISSSTEESHTPPHKPHIISIKEVPKPKPSILDRLGKRPSPNKTPEKQRISSLKPEGKSLVSSVVCVNKDKDKKNEKKPIHERLGLMSRVIPITKPPKRTEPRSSSSEKQTTTLSSVVQIKARKSIPLNKQANRNLLLKAVAEAQKSVIASTTEQKEKEKVKEAPNKKELFTKRFKKNETLKNIIVKVDANTTSEDQNIDSSDKNQFDESESLELEFKDDFVKEIKDDTFKETEELIPQQRFIVTLNGVDQSIFKKKKEEINKVNKLNIDDKEIKDVGTLEDENVDIQKIIVEGTAKKEKRNPSPIIFDKNKIDSPKILETRTGKIYPALQLKVKERCKYWPGCRLGDSCEFLHPSVPCNSFPACKYGDKCLYVHPPCKFDLSCSRRGCPYTHNIKSKSVPVLSSSLPILPPTTIADATKQICKYHPNCTNLQCLYYHPKPCRFGKYCTNIPDCTFSHNEVPTKDKLKWRPS